MSDEQEVPQSIPGAPPATAPEPTAPPPPLHWTNEDATERYAEHFAKDESIEDYARFRKGVDDYEAGTLSEDRREDIKRQILEATEEARAAADGLSSQPDEQPYDPGPDYVSRDEAQRSANMAAATVRMQQYFPDAAKRQEIGETINMYDPAPAITDHIIQSQYGPQIAERLAQHPEAIFDLNEKSPEETRLILSRLEGALMMEQDFARRLQESIPQRRVTQAPPPIRSPKGGASPPSDPFKLATQTDISDYVRLRKSQEKRNG